MNLSNSMLACWGRLVVVAAWAAAHALAVQGRAATERPVARVRSNPNIIVVVTEGVSAGQLGCYGSKIIRTPNLDSMAAEGMRFTDYYVASPSTALSKRSILTGSSETGARRARTPLGEIGAKDWTIAAALKQAGYATAGFGCWELGARPESVPNNVGFTEWFGFLTSAESRQAYPTLLWRNQSQLLVEQNADGKSGVLANDYFTTATLNFLRQKQRQPFFCYLAYAAPTNNHASLVDPAYEALSWTSEEKGSASVLSRIDRDVGRILTHLKTLKIHRETAVFFTSCRGLLKTGTVDPRTFLGPDAPEGSADGPSEWARRAPMIVWWPDHIKPGSVNETPCAAWDVMPTAVEIAGMAAPAAAEGRSWTALFRGETLKERPLAWESEPEYGTPWRAARLGPWKAWLSPSDNAVRLFDLRQDPGEKRDLSGTCPKEVATMRTFLTGALFAPASK